MNAEPPTPENAPRMHAAANESIERMFLTGCEIEKQLADALNGWQMSRISYHVTLNGEYYAGTFQTIDSAREWVASQPNFKDLGIVRTIEEKEVKP